MKRTILALLAVLMLFSGCIRRAEAAPYETAAPLFTTAPATTAAPVSPATPTDPPGTLSGLEMALSDGLTATPGCPWVPVTISFSGRALPPSAPHCSLTVTLDGETVGTWPELDPQPGQTEELELSFSFSRYQPDRVAVLTATLCCGEELLVCQTEVLVDNYPEELYDSLTTDPLPYSIDVLRDENVVVVYGRDEESDEYTVPIRIWLCSTGASTPLGSYSLGVKREWGGLFGGVYGQYVSRIVGDILFHSVPYERMEKDSLETEEYNKLGTTASMGCVRMAVSDVKWIYDNCPEGTPVHIREGVPLPLERPELIPLDPDDPRSCWDPTDPDPENPWNN